MMGLKEMNRGLKVGIFIFAAGLSASAFADVGSFHRCSPINQALQHKIFVAQKFYRVGKIIAGYNWSWGENVGWLNLKASGSDVQVGSNILSGKAWMENCGWVSLGDGRPLNREHYSNESAYDWGVNNDGEGSLSGFAWSSAVGWINFSHPYSRTYIDNEGQFHGYAWAENVGWIHFGPGKSVEYMVRTDPGPWRSIGKEAEFGIASGDSESEGSFVSDGYAPAANLNQGDERYKQRAVIGFINKLGVDDSSTYIRLFEEPVRIDECGSVQRIRGPPEIMKM